ncbi:hypothetical protein Anapl_04643 [Anas platyrhynchos]|uniref:Uncharacterized protein n=1 Tax=Anas platyrhynchos TaxID=8839 RepID=R0LQQ8_ANAPL|nr:hypothetical protein Anapl_04643 [Anas platyrhynchos]
MPKSQMCQDCYSTALAQKYRQLLEKTPHTFCHSAKKSLEGIKRRTHSKLFSESQHKTQLWKPYYTEEFSGDKTVFCGYIDKVKTSDPESDHPTEDTENSQVFHKQYHSDTFSPPQKRLQACELGLARAHVYQTKGFSAKNGQVSEKGGSKPKKHICKSGEKRSGLWSGTQANEAMDDSGQTFSLEGRPHKKHWCPDINPVTFEWFIINLNWQLTWLSITILSTI